MEGEKVDFFFLEDGNEEATWGMSPKWILFLGKREAEVRGGGSK